MSLRAELLPTVRLAGPLIGGQLATMGMNFIDTVMAGNLSAATLGAVAVGASVWSSLGVCLVGVLLAVTAFVAQYDGEGSAESRSRIAPFTRQALWVALALAAAAALLAAGARPLLEAVGVEAEIVPTTAGYLSALVWGIPAYALFLLLRFLSDGLGATRPTLYFSLLGLPINALGNYVLMYGAWGLPALGAVGCGLATSLVWWAQALVLLVYVARHPRYRELDLFARLEMPRWERIGEILRIGAPIAVALFLEMSLFTVVALAIGSLGVVAVAGHQVALNFVALTFMVPLGVAMATTVRVGNAAGRRDPEGVRRAGLAGIGLAVACQVVSATLMLTLPGLIARIYTDDPAVIAVAVELLFFAALFQLSDGVQVSTAGALRGLKDTRAPMLITAVAYWLVGLPVGWYLGFPTGLGAQGLWMGLITGLTLAAVLLAWRFLALTRPGVG